jgi:hypothetical protein
MRTFLQTLMLAVLLLGWTAPLALAEPGAGEGGEDDISAKIQKQMDKIIELMEKNEKALLDLSTGRPAKTEAVDVKPPDAAGAKPPDAAGAKPPEDGSVPPPEGSSGRTGDDARKAIDELIKGQRQAAGSIPGELEELVRMVPQ